MNAEQINSLAQLAQRHTNRPETKSISAAMYDLSQAAQSACNAAALRLDEQTVEIRVLEHKIKRLETAIKTTLNENQHLADGDNCTLIALKQAVKAGIENE